MKVFISSIITGMEEYRAAAGEAITALGYQACVADKPFFVLRRNCCQKAGHTVLTP